METFLEVAHILSFYPPTGGGRACKWNYFGCMDSSYPRSDNELVLASQHGEKDFVLNLDI